MVVNGESKTAVVPSVVPSVNESPLHDMPGDADDFLAKLTTSVPSPVQSEFSDYGSMPRSPASVSGLSGEFYLIMHGWHYQ